VGDPRPATLSLLRQRRFLVRPLIVGALVAVLLTVIYLAMGMEWRDLVILVSIFAVLTAIVALVVCLIAAGKQNRKVLAEGARWAAGSDATHIRIDTPVYTIVVERTRIVSIRRAGALVVLTVAPRVPLGIPVQLLPALVPDAGLADLIE
jgi:hypothetical protein